MNRSIADIVADPDKTEYRRLLLGDWLAVRGVRLTQTVGSSLYTVGIDENTLFDDISAYLRLFAQNGPISLEIQFHYKRDYRVPGRELVRLIGAQWQKPLEIDFAKL
jgi:hypothetical protein